MVNKKGRSKVRRISPELAKRLDSLKKRAKSEFNIKLNDRQASEAFLRLMKNKKRL